MPRSGRCRIGKRPGPNRYRRKRMNANMKKVLKLGVLTGFLAIAAFFVFSKSALAGLSLDENETSMTLASPRSLYLQNCARCHGGDGKSQTALGKQLKAHDISGGRISASKIIRTVTNGRGNMPAFKKKLTAAQIRSLAGYVHSL